MTKHQLISFIRHPWFHFSYWAKQAWCGWHGHGDTVTRYYWVDDPDRGEPFHFCTECGKEVRP